jgi:hypothetical protein
MKWKLNNHSKFCMCARTMLRKSTTKITQKSTIQTNRYLNPETAVDRLNLSETPEFIAVAKILSRHLAGESATDLIARFRNSLAALLLLAGVRVVAPCEEPSKSHTQIRPTAVSRFKTLMWHFSRFCLCRRRR